MSESPIHTVSQAAAKLGVSTSLVRRICRRLDLGKTPSPRLRLLSGADIDRVRKSLGGPVGNPEFRARKGMSAKKSRKKSAAKVRTK